jgi:hypothetical protein
MTFTTQATTVHRINQGVVRTQFVLHPAYARLAKGIDALNGKTTGAAFEKITDPVITREVFLCVMARHPEGILVHDLCEALLKEAKSELSVDDIKARIYAMLVREVGRGLVEPDHGKGKLRKLTSDGHREAALIEQEKARVTALKATQNRISEQTGTNQVPAANGVFDYAQKVGHGVINKPGSNKPGKDQKN